jgi:hypothetical protein
MYLCHTAPSDKELKRVAAFAGMEQAQEERGYCPTYSLRFAHANHKLGLNDFKLSGPWMLYRGDIDKSK